MSSRTLSLGIPAVEPTSSEVGHPARSHEAGGGPPQGEKSSGRPYPAHRNEGTLLDEERPRRLADRGLLPLPRSARTTEVGGQGQNPVPDVARMASLMSQAV